MTDKTIHRRGPLASLAALAAAALLVLSACAAPAGESAVEPSGAATNASVDASADPAGEGPATDSTAAPQGQPAELTAYEGIIGAPPTDPVAVPEDISAWIVSCGQVQGTCSTPSEGVATAAKTLGWESNICDGQQNPNGWANCIRQGIAAGADTILVIGQDCSSVQGALQEAKDAGIMTIGVGGNDCDIDGGEPLYSGTTVQFGGMTNEEWWNTVGELQGEWLIDQTDGQVKLLDVIFETPRFGTWLNDGLHAAMADCESCEIVSTLSLSVSDAASGQLAPKLSSALVQAPEANAVAIPIDGWFMAGLSQVIESSGRSDELAVIGAFGQTANLELIAAGQGQDASVAFNLEWDGWAGVDAALRLMDGQEIRPGGTGLQVVDAENNMPAPGADFSYNPEVDFKAAYQQAWGR
ncbi:substrate-binding domain-containing protein [Citricoccus sp.]|uniref:sugar ABC transporter substrate-binding protein n=1 Tax=Citricoccus sp. TaxID=1978372 RepID=UPI0028BE2DEC|nr:substrate-binding domain-containing protein [Citricoccus sp.]